MAGLSQGAWPRQVIRVEPYGKHRGIALRAHTNNIQSVNSTKPTQQSVTGRLGGCVQPVVGAPCPCGDVRTTPVLCGSRRSPERFICSLEYASVSLPASSALKMFDDSQGRNPLPKGVPCRIRTRGARLIPKLEMKC